MTRINWTLNSIVLFATTLVCFAIVFPIYFALDQSLAMNLPFYGFGIMITLNLLIYIGFVYKIKSKHKKWNENEKLVITKEELERMTNDPNASKELFMEVELTKGFNTFYISLSITFGLVITLITTLIMYYA